MCYFLVVKRSLPLPEVPIVTCPLRDIFPFLETVLLVPFAPRDQRITAADDLGA